MDPVLARIEAWQRAGLIDAVTADRLRADEAAQQLSGSAATVSASPRATTEHDRPTRKTASAADVLGPGPTVAEMFAYLGGGFLLAAWSAFVARLGGDAGSFVVVSGGFLVAAIALGAIGLVLRGGDDRRRRGAGVAFLGATLYASTSAAGVLSGLNVHGTIEILIVTIIAVAVAAIVRLLHAGLLTQFGLLAGITALGWAALGFLGDLVTPDIFDDNGASIGGTVDPLLMILVSAATWLVVALGLGLLALREASARRDSASAPGAPGRRAAFTRAWAGTVAVVGLASALSRSDLLPGGDYGRVVTPWIMDALLLALAALLVERAFRRDSGAFLLAAGIGLITALTDFNFSYLSSSTELGLLIEGGLLLAVGFGADRLRRRLPDGRSPSGPAANPSLEPEPITNAAG